MNTDISTDLENAIIKQILDLNGLTRGKEKNSHIDRGTMALTRTIHRSDFITQNIKFDTGNKTKIHLFGHIKMSPDENFIIRYSLY